MKRKNKFIGGFIAILHCILMSVPLLVTFHNIVQNAITRQKSYTAQYVYDNNGNYQESLLTYDEADYFYLGVQQTLIEMGCLDSEVSSSSTWSDFTLNDFPFLMSNDYIGIFDNGETLSSSTLVYYAYVNFYLNWLINMSILVFVPELILVFITMCRKLVYSFSSKIDGGF